MCKLNTLHRVRCNFAVSIEENSGKMHKAFTGFHCHSTCIELHSISVIFSTEEGRGGENEEGNLPHPRLFTFIRLAFSRNLQNKNWNKFWLFTMTLKNIEFALGRVSGINNVCCYNWKAKGGNDTSHSIFTPDSKWITENFISCMYENLFHGCLNQIWSINISVFW